MVFVQLNEEEKLQVLLLAFGLFLAALLASVCLAASFCPLNRWLLERHSRRRAWQRAQLPAAYLPAGQAHWPELGPEKKIAMASQAGCLGAFVGPPPAYEAALRASRLNSLGLANSKPAGGELDDSSQHSNQTATPIGAHSQLDLGDYFHQPREAPAEQAGCALASDCCPAETAACARAPLMLRIWVRVLEPAELVARARGASGQSSGAGLGRRLSLARQLSIPQLFGSLVSLAAAAGSKEEAGEQQEPRVGPTQASSDSGTSDSIASSSGSSSAAAAASASQAGREESAAPAESAGKRREMGAGRAALASISPITSRVLHMNVASFSYAKDESLISTKRHEEMNWRHFGPGGQLGDERPGKVCQLVISVCDLENALRFSQLNERSCALLSRSSAVYVQCELLAPRSKSAMLLRYPLKALQQGQGASAHTVNLAAASERPLVAAAGSPLAPPPTLSGSGSGGGEQARCCVGATTSWRHEPSADGKSIVVFSSLPKQIAPASQISASSSTGAKRAPDLLQFDAVFVSPILNRSAIGDGFIRLRVYSQCKYVNETCLAELKLPIKRLLKGQSGDNLADAGGAAHRPQAQADFILNNLLANLVTASTGSPLSALIEQGASLGGREECEQEEEEGGQFGRVRGAAQGPFSLGWWSSGGLRASHSAGGSLDEREQVGQCGKCAELQGGGANYCRSLLVSHWLNYLVAPSYECQPVWEQRARLILGLTYLPTSNRLVFNAHRATLDGDSLQAAKHTLKRLRLQSSTCYLLRFLMLADGRLLKRKETPPARRPEWDSQEPITFDLVSVSVEQPAFVVALVVRNAASGLGSAQSLQPNQCNCPLSSAASGAPALGGRSEAGPISAGGGGGGGGAHASSCALHSAELAGCSSQQQRQERRRRQRWRADKGLVVGHLVLAGQIWRELRAQPRRQIVRQFKLY